MTKQNRKMDRKPRDDVKYLKNQSFKIEQKGICVSLTKYKKGVNIKLYVHIVGV